MQDLDEQLDHKHKLISWSNSFTSINLLAEVTILQEIYTADLPPESGMSPDTYLSKRSQGVQNRTLNVVTRLRGFIDRQTSFYWIRFRRHEGGRAPSMHRTYPEPKLIHC